MHSHGAQALQMAIFGGGVAAFAGAMVGVMILAGTLRIGAPTPDGSKPEMDGRLTVGAFLLASHAIAAASLWQFPTIGACIAAGLGAGWIGMAAGGLVALMGQPDRVKARVGGVALRAAVGFGLIAPLWAYAQIMRVHAMNAIGA